MLRLLAVVPFLVGCAGSPAEAEPPPGKPTPPKVGVVARFSSEIGSVPPKLIVEVTNHQAYEIEMVKADKPVCWLPLYLTMTLEKTGGTRVGELLPCKNPGTATVKLAPKASMQVEVGLGELFRNLGKGSYELEIDWDSSGAVAIDTRLVVHAALDQPRRRFTIAKLVKTFTIARGKTVALDNKTQLTFVAHGHKRVMAGGPPSPLIFSGKLVVNGTAQEVGASIHTERQEPFSLERHVFEIVSYKYDESMTLRYWGPIAVDD